MGVQIHKNALKRSPCCNTSYAFQLHAARPMVTRDRGATPTF